MHQREERLIKELEEIKLNQAAREWHENALTKRLEDDKERSLNTERKEVPVPVKETEETKAARSVNMKGVVESHLDMGEELGDRVWGENRCRREYLATEMQKSGEMNGEVVAEKVAEKQQMAGAADALKTCWESEKEGCLVSQPQAIEERPEWRRRNGRTRKCVKGTGLSAE